MRRLAVSIAVMVVALCSSSLGIDYATQYNNGSKLILREGTDSLFCTYNSDGDVKIEYSEGGESWYPLPDIEDHIDPAIAADSTGKRWVVARKPSKNNSNVLQEVYYYSDGAWNATTLYSTSYTNSLGPASLAGAASTTTGIVYAAFLYTSGGTGRIILTKFNGTTVAACTVATVQGGLGDPAVAVEPYKADSDYIHVVWENLSDHHIDYATGVDGRGSGITQYILTSNIPVSDSFEQSQHPSINAERGRAVVVWEQREDQYDCYDVFARERTAGNWQTMQNLSNSASYDCGYPTVAMGDTVVVAWEKQVDLDTFGIFACIDFGTVITVVDTDDFADFPHVVFQNKYDAEGDTFIPYGHVLWSREYYHACYVKIDLKDLGGEGQQSAASVPITVQPSLAACEPNPVRGRTRISYALPAAGNVSLGVYDAAGRPVRMLASGNQPAGNYSVSWDARDADGKQVPYGVYFYRLDTPGFRAVKKAVVTR